MFAYDTFECMKKQCDYCKVEYYQKSNEIWCSPKCRLLSKTKRKKNGCWEFQGSLRRGYSQFKIENKNFATHRVSYEIFKGKIPKGKFVCHTCDNKSCVNPDHLFLGTPSDNMKDKSKKGRAYRPTGEKHHKVKLTAEEVLKIRKMHKIFKTPHKRIAKYFNVSRATITNIINWKYWKHIKKKIERVCSNPKCLKDQCWINEGERSVLFAVCSSPCMNLLRKYANPNGLVQWLTFKIKKEKKNDV